MPPGLESSRGSARLRGVTVQRDHFRPGFQLVEIVRPRLHHLAPLRRTRRAVYGCLQTPIRARVGRFLGFDSQYRGEKTIPLCTNLFGITPVPGGEVDGLTPYLRKGNDKEKAPGLRPGAFCQIWWRRRDSCSTPFGAGWTMPSSRLPGMRSVLFTDYPIFPSQGRNNAGES